MKLKLLAGFALAAVAAGATFALGTAEPAIAGHYLESRTCDIYTGPCFANGEMGKVGREAILVWKVAEGAHEGVVLDGLSVIAVLRTTDTMGDVNYDDYDGKAVLVVDESATDAQREALATLAKAKAGALIDEVIDIVAAPIDAKLGTCDGSGCATVSAGDLIEVKTRCFGEKDHVCGNERTFYPPLTEVIGAYPAYTEVAAYRGEKLDLTWESTEARSTFLATFAQ